MTPAAPANPAVKKTGTKKLATKKTATKKVTTAAPAKKPSESNEKDKPQFQHTSALLELAGADKDSAEKNSDSTETISDSTETNKMEESENHLVDNMDDSEENADNMIIVSNSEDSKQDDEEIDDNDDDAFEDEEAALGESHDEEVNDAKENDDNVAAESSVVETVEKLKPKPLTKKTKKKDKGNRDFRKSSNKLLNAASSNDHVNFESHFFLSTEEEGILDLVVSAITGTDDDEDDKTKIEVKIIDFRSFMFF